MTKIVGAKKIKRKGDGDENFYGFLLLSLHKFRKKNRN